MRPLASFMTDERIIAYLLQELTEEEAERFEEECFAQEKWPAAELNSVEQDLIDAYLGHELSTDRRRRFEEKYLITDARKARVLTAQSFQQVLCPARKKSWKETIQAFWQRPLVPQFAVAILILAVLTPVIIPYFISPKTFTHLHLAITAPDRGDGTQMALVKLPLSTDALKIYLQPPEQSSPDTTYRVEWENANGPLGVLSIKEQDSQSIVVVIPSNKLSPGRYTLKLFQTNPRPPAERLPDSYFFTAEATR
jgi:hypothetical protein